MKGYKICVYRLTEKPPEDTSYCRENQEQLYEQKVDELDMKALIAVINKLPSL